LQDIFKNAYKDFTTLDKEQLKDAAFLKKNCEAFGNVFLGHLRYGTHGGLSEKVCHPFYRKSNWITRNLVLAGNFNMTNVDDLLNHLIELGQHPRQKADTVLVLEKIGHFLDNEVQLMFNKLKAENVPNSEITKIIARDIDLEKVLRRAVKGFDGGYVMTGITGPGDAFVFRDPNGIRPAYYYSDDEVTVVASERPAIQTAFHVDYSKIIELPPAHALILKNGKAPVLCEIQTPKEKKSCSFERIYFARGTDADIYKERKELGKLLAPMVYDAINQDFSNTVFSYIPNTSETAFIGLVKGLEKIYREQIVESIKNNLNTNDLQLLVEDKVRIEKVIVKDAKLRTFITDDSNRNSLVSHVYDITYGSIRPQVDQLCILDDSIVRGTTLKNSIISILAKLKPRKIIVVSSAPQIRYPDCYGIDMSRLGDFLIFKALIALIKRDQKESVLKEIYELCKIENQKPLEEIENKMIALYKMYSIQELNKKAAEIVTPEGIDFEVELVFQPIENLELAFPEHSGKWYFDGRYATNGGNKVANQSFINYFEGNNARAY